MSIHGKILYCLVAAASKTHKMFRNDFYNWQWQIAPVWLVLTTVYRFGMTYHAENDSNGCYQSLSIMC